MDVPMSPAILPLHRAIQHAARALRSFVAWLRRPEHAQGLVEYAMLLLLIAVAVIGAVTLFGARVSTLYSEVDCKVTGAVEQNRNPACP